MPQWQGGNLAEYHLSSQLLSWLLPPATGPEETIAIQSPSESAALLFEDGIIAKSVLLDQARAARSAIEKHRPDRVLTIGGDCLVDLAPIAYLSRKYREGLGVLWIDAHPDVQSSAVWPHAHAHVLAMLLGEGDSDFVAEVDQQIRPSNVMYAGLDQWSSVEDEVIAGLGLSVTSSAELASGSGKIVDWLKSNDIKYLAVHLDVDVLLPSRFRPLLFNNPDAREDFLDGVPRGRLTPTQVIDLLNDASQVADIVGLAITEFISWDALQARALLTNLPLVKG